MRKLLAIVPVLVGAVAGYAIAFRAIPPGSLAATLDEVTRVLGPGLTGALALCLGLVLSWLISRSSDSNA